MSSIYLAPEWERQDAIILVWPHTISDWSEQLTSIEKTYCELAHRISLKQQVIIIAYNLDHEQSIHTKLNEHSINENNVITTCIPSNDTWVRDYGPISIKFENGYKLLNFEFDAWGGKYEYHKDNAFSSKFCEKLNLAIPCEQIDFVLEGGNLEVNSQGELLSSVNCFSRQSNLNIRRLEKKLRTWFGIQRVYWIDCIKLEGDDTDGHIDTLARFCSDEIIVYSAANNSYDQNTEMLQTLYSELKNIRQQANNKFELVPLPLPTPIHINKQQLPATYANFLITNHYVLVPTFDDEQDSYALRTLQEIFPTREVIGINSLAMIQQLGGLHCATMHLSENTFTMKDANSNYA